MAFDTGPITTENRIPWQTLVACLVLPLLPCPLTTARACPRAPQRVAPAPCAGVWALGSPKLAVIGCQFADVDHPVKGDLHVDDFLATFRSSNSVTPPRPLGFVRRYRLPAGCVPVAFAVGLLYAAAATAGLRLWCPARPLTAWLQAVVVSLLWDIVLWQVWGACDARGPACRQTRREVAGRGEGCPLGSAMWSVGCQTDRLLAPNLLL